MKNSMIINKTKLFMEGQVAHMYLNVTKYFIGLKSHEIVIAKLGTTQLFKSGIKNFPNFLGLDTGLLALDGSKRAQFATVRVFENPRQLEPIPVPEDLKKNIIKNEDLRLHLKRWILSQISLTNPILHKSRDGLYVKEWFFKMHPAVIEDLLNSPNKAYDGFHMDPKKAAVMDRALKKLEQELLGSKNFMENNNILLPEVPPVILDMSSEFLDESFMSSDKKEGN